jgi:hypothetical protein
MNGYNSQAEEVQLPPISATVPCVSCGGEMPRMLHAQAHTLVCSCKRIYSNGPKGLEYEGIFNDKKAPKPWIPLGSTGLFKEIKYRVVGYQVNKEQGKIYSWCEYVLFNPLHGYAFLSEYDGHWTFFRYVGDLKHSPLFEKELRYQNKDYLLFNKYRGQPVFALGEFPWDLMRDQGQVSEFVCPPYCLNKVVSQDEISWMQGQYLQPEEVQKTFGIQAPPPTRVGTGAAEPLSLTLSWEKSSIAALAASFLLIALQALFMISSGESLVLNDTYAIPASTNASVADPISASSFELKPDWFGTTNLEFTLRAPVQNSWFAMGITLIHQQSGKEYDFEMGVEYYSGYEDGTNWSEGSTKEEKLLSALEPGTYQMLIYPYRDPNSRLDVFSLEVNRDVVIWSNLWLIALLIWLIPIIQKIREHYFERSRWMNSDYSPYDEE